MEINKSVTKRPKIITIFLVFFFFVMLFDFSIAIKLDKDKYIKETKTIEMLIKNDPIWSLKNDVEKKMILKNLQLTQKALSNFILYYTLEWLFVVLDSLLVFGLWKMKKWTFIVLVCHTLNLLTFNTIFTLSFASYMGILFYIIPAIILLSLFYKKYQKYFIY